MRRRSVDRLRSLSRGIRPTNGPRASSRVHHDERRRGRLAAEHDVRRPRRGRRRSALARRSSDAISAASGASPVRANEKSCRPQLLSERTNGLGLSHASSEAGGRGCELLANERMRMLRAGRDPFVTLSTARLGGVLVLACVVSAAALPAVGHAQAAPPSPGPPPGAGSRLGPAPIPGSSPVSLPPGAPATISSRVSGPSLASGIAVLRVSSRLVSLRLACQPSGRVGLSAANVAEGTLAQGPYVCSCHRSGPLLRLSRREAQRLVRLGSTLATVTVRQGPTTVRLTATLQAGTHAAGPGAGATTGCSARCSGAIRPI